jgi:aspartate racemase
MHIGLIGGIGPAATDFYYRRMISTFARMNATLELTIVHADTPTLLSNLARNDAAAQTAIYSRLTNRLVSAGAECVGVTSIAGHFCIDNFKALSPLPVVDMVVEVSRAIEARGLKRIGVLGTRTVIETRFYGRIASAEIVPPNEPDLGDVHQAYISMAPSGLVTAEQRAIFHAVSHRLLGNQGVGGDHAWGHRSRAGFQRTDYRFPADRLCGYSCRCDCTVGNCLMGFGQNHLLWFPITGYSSPRFWRSRNGKSVSLNQ